VDLLSFSCAATNEAKKNINPNASPCENIKTKQQPKVRLFKGLLVFFFLDKIFPNKKSISVWPGVYPVGTN